MAQILEWTCDVRKERTSRYAVGVHRSYLSAAGRPDDYHRY